MTPNRIGRGSAAVLNPILRALAIAGVCAAASAATQAPQSVETLMAQPAIRAALDFVKVNEPDVVNEQIQLCEIPAPPFGEQQRAEAYRAAFERLGLEHVRIDAVGNVLAERP